MQARRLNQALHDQLQRLQLQTLALQSRLGAQKPEPDRLTLLSYNVLIPNSSYGWWVYKYYDAAVPEFAKTWHWRKTLIRKQIIAANATIVCLQECFPESFAEDFAFMSEAGYQQVFMEKGARMRNATFWRSSQRGRELKLLLTYLPMRSRQKAHRDTMTTKTTLRCALAALALSTLLLPAVASAVPQQLPQGLNPTIVPNKT